MSTTSGKTMNAVWTPLERGVRRLAGAWRAWRRRRYWTAERQLENLRNMVQGDHRWLAHDKVADALTTRYLAALAPDWMGRVHACPDHFRREIGLDPQHAFRVAAPAEVLARAQRLWICPKYYGAEGHRLPAHLTIEVLHEATKP